MGGSGCHCACYTSHAPLLHSRTWLAVALCAASQVSGITCGQLECHARESLPLIELGDLHLVSEPQWVAVWDCNAARSSLASEAYGVGRCWDAMSVLAALPLCSFPCQVVLTRTSLSYDAHTHTCEHASRRTLDTTCDNARSQQHARVHRRA